MRFLHNVWVARIVGPIIGVAIGIAILNIILTVADSCSQ